MTQSKQQQILDLQERAIYMRDLYLYNSKFSEKQCKEVSVALELKAIELANTK